MMLQDIRNAISFLAIKREVDGGRIALVGSSLGANLALLAASQPWAAAVRCVVAISPGLDYQGLKTEKAAKNIPQGVHVLLAAAKDDAYSFTSATTLFKLLKKPKEFSQVEEGGHGVHLFAKGLLHQTQRWVHTALTPPTKTQR